MNRWSWGGLVWPLCMAAGCGGDKNGDTCGPGTVLDGSVCLPLPSESGPTNHIATQPDGSSDSAVPDAPIESGADADGSDGFVLPTCPMAAGDGDGGYVGDAGGRILRRVLEAAPWNVRQSVAGLAVDAQHRAYLSDPNYVYAVTCGRPSVYMTLTEAASIAGVSQTGPFLDLDIAPDGALQILVGEQIIRSSAPHQGQLFQSKTGLGNRLGVIANDRVAVMSSNGLTVFTPGGSTVVYSAAQVSEQQNCAAEDLTTANSGVFLYENGCNGSPILRGNVDGSGVSILGMTEALQVANFICSARDPAGGFYTVATDSRNGLNLYHVDETATGAQAFALVTTSPSLLEAAASQSETFAFMFCSLAAGPDGTLFFQTMSQLWSVSP